MTDLVGGFICIGMVLGLAYLPAWLRRVAGKGAPADKADRQRATRPTITVTVRSGSGHAARGERLTARPHECWVPGGQTVRVHGYDIPGGLLYVGSGLAAVAPHSGVDPALIDKRLPVNRQQPAYAGEGMSYWPSYSRISPACRAAYLEWLAGGRVEPNAYVGYPFLFLYGLERRVLADVEVMPLDTAELKMIVREVRRLRRLYSHNGSFRGYSTSLLDMLTLLHAKRPLYTVAPRLGQAGRDIPVTVRTGLAQLARDGRPIPPAWAYAWIYAHADTRRRTVLTRCETEVRKLFHLRYRARYGAGLIVKPNKRKLRVDYLPASASFGGTFRWTADDLPDIIALSGPTQKLRELFEECQHLLEPYSRWRGRNRDTADSLAGVALLPGELAATHKGENVRAFRTWLSGVTKGTEAVVTSGRDLMDRWQCGDPRKLRKSEAVALAQFLEHQGFGLEPDVRFGGPAIQADSVVLVFPLPPDLQLRSPSGPYTAATVLLHLGAMVSAADGEVSDEEERTLAAHLQKALGLDAAERTRLGAHLRWLLTARPGMAGVKKRLEPLSRAQKHMIGRFLIGVAGADGRIDPGEIRILGKLYPLLGLDTAEVYSDIHALAAGSGGPPAANAPVLVKPAESGDRGYAIPDRTPGESVVLDMARVRATLRETATVSSLLGTIFVEDEESSPAIPAAPTPAPGDLVGVVVGTLDTPHSHFLRELAAQLTWPRADIEALADRVGLMPDGALELVNEAAFELVGDPVWEGDDPIELDEAILQEMLT